MQKTPQSPPPVASVVAKLPCRLCYYDTDDTVEIFGAAGQTANYAGKIARYLYLRCSAGDSLPQVVCWMCAQHLVTFDQFYAKINHIQRVRLKDGYESIVIGGSDEKATIETETTAGNVSVVEPTESPAKSTSGRSLRTRSKMQSNRLVKEEPNATTEIDSSDGDANTATQVVETPIEDDDSGKVVVEYEATTSPPPMRRKRGRPSGSTVVAIDAQRGRRTRSKIATKSVKVEPEQNEESAVVVKEVDVVDGDNDVDDVNDVNDDDEGESGDEFPRPADVSVTDSSVELAATDAVDASDSSDDDGDNDADDNNVRWARRMAEGKFPTEVIRNGLLLIKGERLMRIINKFYTLSCELCPARNRFAHLHDLFEHFRSEHQQAGHVRCCEAAFSRYPAIIMHMARHLQPSAFRCEQCGYVGTRPRFLETHRLTHLPDAEKPFGCVYCGRRFCWKRALAVHERTHKEARGEAAAADEVDTRRYECDACGKFFATSGGLRSHWKWQHSDRKPESGVCHICAKSFATRAGLNEHMELHRPREQTQLQCAECGKWLMNQRCLKSHMILHSSEVLRCDRCPYTTKKAVLMRRHTVNRHTDERPFGCAVCGKRFKLKRPLTVHMEQSHAVKQPQRHECPFCGRQFNSSTNFYAHRKNRHPQELAALRAAEAAERRLKRIEAGIEVPDETAAVGEELDVEVEAMALGGDTGKGQMTDGSDGFEIVYDYVMDDGGSDSEQENGRSAGVDVDDDGGGVDDTADEDDGGMVELIETVEDDDVVVI